MGKNRDNGQFVLSEGILQDGTFGIYLVSEENPSLEYHIVGGCGSLDEARVRAKDIIPKIPGLKEAEQELESIQFRKRPKVEVDKFMKMMEKEDLAESIRTHLDHSVAKLKESTIITKLTKSKIIKGLLSYQNLIFLITCLAIWLFWSEGSFTIPEDLDLPLVGDRLGGTVLNAEMLARYFPITLLILYVVKFLLLLKTNLEYDLLRREILALVFQHGWRFKDFILILTHIKKSLEKSNLGWLMNVSEWFHTFDPASLGNLRKQAEASSQSSQGEELDPQEVDKDEPESTPSSVQKELDKKLAEWIPTEFERRIHNLYFLDKEPDYSRLVICFDPLLYVTSLNRITFRVYEFLKQKGVPVDPYNVPTDPYLVQRIAAPVCLFAVAFHVLFIGGVMVWSLFVAGNSQNMLFFANLLAVVLVIVGPNYWNYLVMVKRRGYPKVEPLGAYTVGPMTPNSLSLL